MAFPAEIKHDRHDGIYLHRLCIQFVAIRCTIVANHAERHRFVHARLILDAKKCEAQLAILPELRNVAFLLSKLSLDLIRRLRRNVRQFFRMDDLITTKKADIEDVREHVRIRKQLLFRNILLPHALTAFHTFLLQFYVWKQVDVNGCKKNHAQARQLPTLACGLI